MIRTNRFFYQSYTAIHLLRIQEQTISNFDSTNFFPVADSSLPPLELRHYLLLQQVNHCVIWEFDELRVSISTPLVNGLSQTLPLSNEQTLNPICVFFIFIFLFFHFLRRVLLYMVGMVSVRSIGIQLQAHRFAQSHPKVVRQ
jgi:hypothetical protein